MTSMFSVKRYTGHLVSRVVKAGIVASRWPEAKVNRLLIMTQKPCEAENYRCIKRLLRGSPKCWTHKANIMIYGSKGLRLKAIQLVMSITRNTQSVHTVNMFPNLDHRYIYSDR